MIRTRLLPLLLGFWIINLIPDHAMSQHRLVYAQGKSIRSPDGHALLIRGIGLGNWLVQEGYMFQFGDEHAAPHEIINLSRELIGPASADSFWDQFYRTYITRDDIRFLHQVGFNCVRVPFNFRLLAHEDDPDLWKNGPGWAALDSVVSWCRQEHLYVVLDMHCAPGGQTGANIDDSYGYPFLYRSAESQAQWIRLWVSLSLRFKNNSTILGYDLLNEPLPHRSYYDRYLPLLEPLYRRAVAAIRGTGDHHLIILEGANWASNFDAFHRPFDPGLIYEFHYYWNPPILSGIQKFLGFRDRYRVPIWMGESGENTDGWISTFRQLLEQNRIGWSFWPYKKMNSTRGVVSVSVPRDWDRIMWYSRQLGGEEVREKAHLRDSLPVDTARTAFAALLMDIPFQKCKVNWAYIQALGLKADTTN